VDAQLEEARAAGIGAIGVYACYTEFGKDPLIVSNGDSPDVQPRFSASEIAGARCEQMCAGPRP